MKTLPALYPLEQELASYAERSLFAPHCGLGSLRPNFFSLGKGSTIKFDGCCLHPTEGNCLILLRWPELPQIRSNMGEDLTVEGGSGDGPFRLHCPRFRVQSDSGNRARPAWAIATPRNAPMTITYGEPRPVAKVQAIINNFDFEQGNVPPWQDGPKAGTKGLLIEAEDRPVLFTWRPDRAAVRRLLECELLRSAALVEFSFDAWPTATENDLLAFAGNVATLCAIVARQHVGIPVLTFLDGAGRPIKRIIRQPVRSQFRSGYLLPSLEFDDGLPKLFRQYFGELGRLQQSSLWQPMPFFLTSIEDAPYLEQNFATLTAAIEMLVKSALIEQGSCTAASLANTKFPALIGLARHRLGWNIPKHYKPGQLVLATRNAVAHGDGLPATGGDVRRELEKWKLFAFRRYLMRLGFDGEVTSPHKGRFQSSSPVNNFTEEFNCLVPQT